MDESVQLDIDMLPLVTKVSIHLFVSRFQTCACVTVMYTYLLHIDTQNTHLFAVKLQNQNTPSIGSSKLH